MPDAACSSRKQTSATPCICNPARASVLDRPYLSFAYVRGRVFGQPASGSRGGDGEVGMKPRYHNGGEGRCRAHGIMPPPPERSGRTDPEYACDLRFMNVHVA